jgi:hypothetical protein
MATYTFITEMHVEGIISCTFRAFLVLLKHTHEKRNVQLLLFRVKPLTKFETKTYQAISATKNLLPREVSCFEHPTGPTSSRSENHAAFFGGRPPPPASVFSLLRPSLIRSEQNQDRSGSDYG